MIVHSAPSDPPEAEAAGQAGDGSGSRQRALARLVASRQRLQSTWLPSSDPSSGPRGARRSGRWSVLWRRWRRRLDRQPLVGMALDAAEQWWQHNPWHLAGRAVASELDGALTPWLRRHPGWAVAIAAGTGYAVVRARPWAWPGVAGPLRLLPRHISRWLLTQLTQLPLQSLLTGLALAGGWSTSAPSPKAGAAPDQPTRPAQTGDPGPDGPPGPLGVV